MPPIPCFQDPIPCFQDPGKSGLSRGLVLSFVNHCSNCRAPCMMLFSLFTARPCPFPIPHHCLAAHQTPAPSHHQDSSPSQQSSCYVRRASTCPCRDGRPVQNSSGNSGIIICTRVFEYQDYHVYVLTVLVGRSVTFVNYALKLRLSMALLRGADSEGNRCSR